MNNEINNDEEYKTYITEGSACGVTLGCLFGFIFPGSHIAGVCLGISLGLLIGLTIGSCIKKKNN